MKFKILDKVRLKNVALGTMEKDNNKFIENDVVFIGKTGVIKGSCNFKSESFYVLFDNGVERLLHSNWLELVSKESAMQWIKFEIDGWWWFLWISILCILGGLFFIAVQEVKWKKQKTALENSEMDSKLQSFCSKNNNLVKVSCTVYNNKDDTGFAVVEGMITEERKTVYFNIKQQLPLVYDVWSVTQYDSKLFFDYKVEK